MASEKTKTKIVETAIELFNENGFKGVTMDDIATNLHISKRTMYEIFASKNDLVRECLTQIHREMAELRMEAINKTDEPMLATLYIMHLTANKWHKYLRIFGEAERFYPEMNALLIKSYGTKFKESMRDIINEAYNNGDLRKNIDIDAAIEVIMHSVRTYPQSESSDQVDPTTFSLRVREASYTYLRGLLSAKAIERADKNTSKFRELLGE